MPHRLSLYWSTAEGKYLGLAFRDKKAKKPVLMVTNSGSSASATTKSGTEKPSVVHAYNQYINGCDKADQMLGYFGLQSRRTVKWWRKIFFWMMDIAMQSAFIIYKLTRVRPLTKVEFRRLTFKNFKCSLVLQLQDRASHIDADEGVEPIKPCGRPFKDAGAEKHLPGKHLIQYVEDDCRCQVCSKPGDRKRNSSVQPALANTTSTQKSFMAHHS